MKVVQLDSFNIEPILESASRLKISDAEYFGPNYKEYISNSKLKLINPDQGGSPELYKNGLKSEDSTSLRLGSAIHELFLQGEIFNLKENLHKPSAKLGDVVDRIRFYRLKNTSIWSSIYNSCQDIGYYAKSLTPNRIKTIISKGLNYYLNSKELKENDIVLSDKDTEICKTCLESLISNTSVWELVHPKSSEELPIYSYNEDALFLDVKVTFENKEIILKLKAKADNWTYEPFTETIVLNDLKTTSKPFPFFMKDYGSFVHYHYARQLAMYSWMLKEFCKKEYNINNSVGIKSNIIVVETLGQYRAHCYNINNKLIKQGFEELLMLLKMVAYYEICGYDEVVTFI